MFTSLKLWIGFLRSAGLLGNLRPCRTALAAGRSRSTGGWRSTRRQGLSYPPPSLPPSPPSHDLTLVPSGVKPLPCLALALPCPALLTLQGVRYGLSQITAMGSRHGVRRPRKA